MASTGTRRRARRPSCPFCGYDDQVVPISYGLPGPELVEQSQRGEVALGGCCIGPDSHDWYCKGCLRSFTPTECEEDLSLGKATA
jgi:hypothetical protein